MDSPVHTATLADDDFRCAPLPFDVPRALTGNEIALTSWLVERLPFPELRAQLDSVRAVAGCECGCPSISLATDGPPVPAGAVRAHNAAAMAAYYERAAEPRPEVAPRDDYVDVYASGRNCDGREVAVILKLLDGRLEELEVWTGDIEHTATDLPDVSTLRLAP